MLRPPLTIPVAAVLGLLTGVRGKQIATPAWIEELLYEADIPPTLLEQPGSRVTAEQYVALFRLLVERLDDESVGLLSRPFRRGSFALMLRSMVGVSTLDAALSRMADAFGLLQDDVNLVLTREGPLAGLVLERRDEMSTASIVQHEYLLRIFWRLLVWLSGGKLTPRRFDFAFAQPPYSGSYIEIFPAPMYFNQPRSAVWFDSGALAAPMRRDAQAIEAFVRASLRHIVAAGLRERAISTRVRSVLQQARPAWLDMAAAAERLHMSVSTLKRQLAAEGISFQSLKDQLRRDLAIVRLNTSEVSLATLAQELGFADSAAFQRAFKTWTGSAPGSYRSGRASGDPTRSTRGS